ncbi:Putative electron transfer flavoprotein subunit [Savitreella phatthalungensis]
MTSLRIMCATKRVLDYALKPRIAKGGAGVDLTGQKQSLNPFCEIGVEEAVRLREKLGKDKVSDIVAFSAGPPKAQDTLRTALAMGADRALLVEVAESDTPKLEPLSVAKLIAGAAKEEKADIVILGKQAIDTDNNQTGQMLAGLLGWGQATCASKVEVGEGGKEVKVEREVDGGTETVEVKLPCVITTDLRLNEPRFATLPNIMKAKKKPLAKKKPQDYGVDLANPRLKLLKVEEPPTRQGGDKVADVDSLVAKLKELKAI